MADVLLACSGRLAQLGERLPYKQEVAGSSPAPPIVFAEAEAVIQAGESLAKPLTPMQSSLSYEAFVRDL